jgi:hypothetical protein
MRARVTVLLASTLAAGGYGSIGASPVEAHAFPRAVAAIVPSDSHASSPKVRFARDIEPIFMSACSGEYCHGNFVNTPARAYRFFVDQPSTECEGRTLVVPGRPDASYLMEKVRGKEVCAGQPMPRGAGNSLRPDQIELLRAWISGGASFD